MATDRLPAPRRGEWRSVVREREQSFDEYVRVVGNRKTVSASRLRLLPLGGVSSRFGELLGLMREYASVFFGFEVSLAADVPVPDAAHVTERDQYNSSMILDALASGAAEGDPLLLAITDVDLFSRGLSYVFGEGNLDRRVGICSLRRLRSPDEVLVRRRALRLLSHEAGHLLSIPHCVRRRCVMQGSNTLEESDRHPMEPCSEDRRKIRWRTGVDLVRRSVGLRTLYERWGWPLESGFGNSDLG